MALTFASMLELFMEFLIHSTLLTLFLWIMIKLQKLDHNWLGLIGSALLAGGLDMVPHYGHFIAVPVLYICIARVTRASLFPDAAFTVVISYALMFLLNMIILTAITPDLAENFRHSKTESDAVVADDKIKTNIPPITAAKTNAAAAMTVHPTAPAPTSVDDFMKIITVQAVTMNGSSSSITFQLDDRHYTIVRGQAVALITGGKSFHVTLKDVSQDTVTLDVNGETRKLPVY